MVQNFMIINTWLLNCHKRYNDYDKKATKKFCLFQKDS